MRIEHVPKVSIQPDVPTSIPVPSICYIKGRGTSPDSAGDDKGPQTLCFCEAIVSSTCPPRAIVVPVGSVVLGAISLVPGTVVSLYSVANQVLRLVLSGT